MANGALESVVRKGCEARDRESQPGHTAAIVTGGVA